MVIDNDSIFLLTSADGSKKAFGTGFAVAYKDGRLYLLTCAHVAEQLDGRIRAAGQEAEILVKGSADGIDLALLRIPCGQPPPLLNRAVQGKKGLQFHICGYGPFAGAKDNYVLRHIEGKLGKSIAFESSGGGRVEAWDLHVEDDDFSRLQGGYSGSPLCDEQGRLIAVVSHKVDAGQRGHAISIANINNALPSISNYTNIYIESKRRRRSALSLHRLCYLLKSNIKITISMLSSLVTIATLVSWHPKGKYYLSELINSTVKDKEITSNYNLHWDVKKTDPQTEMKIVYIPKGCFRMGSPKYDQNRLKNEEPVNEICVSSFWMGQYEVTQSQWEKIMGSNQSHFDKKGANYPAESVSHEEVLKFLENLNEKTGEKFRLPTEAEWEYAARAGTDTVRYWGNDDLSCDKAMYENNPNEHDDCVTYIMSKGLTPGHTAPVGSYPPNKFGLYDILGNVWEWCLDWYQDDYYSSIQKDNPNGPSSGVERVIRGGCWRDNPGLIRSAFRRGFDPEKRVRNIGFRIVLPIQENIDNNLK